MQCILWICNIIKYKTYNNKPRAHCNYCIRSDTRRLISSSSAVFHRDAGRKSRLLIVAANEEQLIGDCLLTISWQRISSRHVHHAPLVWSSHRHRHILQYLLSVYSWGIFDKFTTLFEFTLSSLSFNRFIRISLSYLKNWNLQIYKCSTCT